MTIHERAALVASRLEHTGLPARDAIFDTTILMRHALGWDRARWILGQHDAEPPGFEQAIERLVSRRVEREPVAYILGAREFWSLDLEVTPDVLIPRPETEFLVEEALARLPRPAPGLTPRVIDVGTGSGCVAVSLAHDRADIRVTATDISPAALAVAARNARRHGVEDRIRFEVRDLLEGVIDVPDVIVSNPPYVARRDGPGLSREVGGHEPHVALFGGDADGRGTIRRLLAQSAALLAPGGWLLFEFGYGQEIDGLVAAHPTLKLDDIREDLQGIPRTAIVRRV